MIFSTIITNQVYKIKYTNTPLTKMDTSTSTRKFAKQISLDEYNNQKKEYTEKALLELKSQMAAFKPKSKSNQDTQQNESEDDSGDNSGNNSGDNSGDCSFDEKSAGVNVIIKTYKESAKSGEKDSNTGLRKRRVPSKSIDEGTGASAAANSLANSIYVQRELDLQEIQKLKNQIKRLKSNLEEEERKNHFLKLDLCNANVDISDLKNVLSVHNNKFKQLDDKHNTNWWQIIKLKICIGILCLLYIYTFIF